MEPDERIKSLTRQILVVVSIHTIVFAICFYAHQKIDLLYDINALLPFLFLFCLVPIITGIFLLTKYIRLGAIVLLGILPAALINNVLSRFTGLPPLVIQEPALIWKIVYEGAFGLAVISEAVGSWLTYKLLEEIHKEIDLPAVNPGNGIASAKGSKSKSSPKKIVTKRKRH